jgi:hypothetical protein
MQWVNLEDYLEKNPPTSQYDYVATWVLILKTGSLASPDYFIDKTHLLLIYVGDKPYGSIKQLIINLTALKPFQPESKVLFILIKKYVPMVYAIFF